MRNFFGLLLILGAAALSTLGQQPETYRIPPDEEPIQFTDEMAVPLLVEATQLIRADEARNQFQVDGSGLTAAVLDTGCRVTHIDFRGRVVATRNFTDSDGGDANNVTDRKGHGTNVAGIVAAGGNHTGIAPGANIAVVKVLNDTGSSVGNSIADGLQWVIENAAAHNIRVVNMSLGAPNNLTDDSTFAASATRQKIQTLRARGIAVIVAAGNSYFGFKNQGMSSPGVFRETISVGAVYDTNIGGPVAYASGASAKTTGADRVCPFSQRLHETTNASCRTDVFAPGAVLTSTGITDDSGTSMMNGTSQATPIVAGVVLLMQEHYNSVYGRFPTVDEIETALRTSARTIVDGDDEDDNVPHAGLSYARVDAVNAVDAIVRNARIARRQQMLGIH